MTWQEYRVLNVFNLFNVFTKFHQAKKVGSDSEPVFFARFIFEKRLSKMKIIKVFKRSNLLHLFLSFNQASIPKLFSFSANTISAIYVCLLVAVKWTVSRPSSIPYSSTQCIWAEF